MTFSSCCRVEENCERDIGVDGRAAACLLHQEPRVEGVCFVSMRGSSFCQCMYVCVRVGRRRLAVASVSVTKCCLAPVAQQEELVLSHPRPKSAPSLLTKTQMGRVVASVVRRLGGGEAPAHLRVSHTHKHTHFFFCLYPLSAVMTQG